MAVLFAGPTPQDGKSAYQIWLDLGNVGTEAQFIASLKGPQGVAGPQGAAGIGSPVGSILFGVFDANKFAGNGLGKAGTDMYGWAWADGRNGTVNMRGFTAAGGLNYGSGTQDPIVDPALYNDPDYNNNVGARKGEVKHKMSISEMPEHDHKVNDPGHIHGLSALLSKPSTGGNVGTYGDWGNPFGKNTDSATTGITVDKRGSNAPHNNIQPTVFLHAIQKIF